MSSGLFAPLIGIRRVFLLSSSSMSSKVSPRLSRVLAASRSSTVFVAASG